MGSGWLPPWQAAEIVAEMEALRTVLHWWCGGICLVLGFVLLVLWRLERKQ